MLEDRVYMRRPTYGTVWPLTYVLMAVNAAIFFLQSLLEFYRIFPVTYYFALSLEGLLSGQIWQLITFQFLHGGLWHLVFNLIGIYFFGRPMEELLGRRRFLQLYLLSGSVGGLLQMLFAALFPGYFGAAVVGASAGAFGLVAAFAVVYPDRTLTLLLFFVVPISMRARTLLWLSIGVAVAGILVPGGVVADAAHLGGILTGWAYVAWAVQGRRWFPQMPASRPVRRPRVLVRTAHGPSRAWPMSRPSASPAAPEEFISREVDPILDKILARGFQSLTEEERQILERARARMRRD